MALAVIAVVFLLFKTSIGASIRANVGSGNFDVSKMLNPDLIKSDEEAMKMSVKKISSMGYVVVDNDSEAHDGR